MGQIFSLQDTGKEQTPHFPCLHIKNQKNYYSKREMRVQYPPLLLHVSVILLPVYMVLNYHYIPNIPQKTHKDIPYYLYQFFR